MPTEINSMYVYIVDSEISWNLAHWQSMFGF